MIHARKLSFSFFKFMLLSMMLLAGTQQAKATHALGSDLTYECIGQNQYRLTLTLYRDCNGINFSSTQSIVWSGSCGSGVATATMISTQDITPICPSQQSACGGNGVVGVQQNVYTVDITTPAGCTNINFSSNVCCHNNSITTINGGPALYAEAKLPMPSTTPCNNSPTFLNPPSIFTCVNTPTFYNHGAIDSDGDSLDFSLVNAKTSATGTVNYLGGYSGPVPLGPAIPVTIDNKTGIITFTPTNLEITIISVLVREYRNGVLIGSITRSVEFRVLNCTNQSSTITGINGSNTGNFALDYTTETCPNTPICFNVTATDTNGNNMHMYWNGGISGATFTSPTSPSNYQAGPVVGQFCWTPTTADTGTHTFTVTVEDDVCPLAGSSTFTYVINVNPNPNDPVDAGLDIQICVGDTATLSATSTAGNIQSFTWTPVNGSPTLSNPNSPTTQVFPTGTTTYNVTLQYTDGCSSTDQVTVQVIDPPEVEIFPGDIFTCASAQFTLSGTSNNATNKQFEWTGPSGSLGAGNVSGASSSLSIITPSLPGTYTYTLTVTDTVTGCSSSESSTITIGTPPLLPGCVNLYVDNQVTTPAAGTQLHPTTLADALSRVSCNNAVIKLDTGLYIVDSTMIFSSFLTIEGGFRAADSWSKTARESATIIRRSTANPDGVANAQRLVAFASIGGKGFRLQDLTIETADANQPGMSTYGIHLQNPSDYTLARVRIFPGKGGDGPNGTAGQGRSGALGTHPMDGGSGTAGISGTTDPAQGAGGSGGRGGFATALVLGGAGGNGGATIGSHGVDGAGIAPGFATQFSRNGGSGGGGGSGGCTVCTIGSNTPNTGYDGGLGGQGGSPAPISPSNPHNPFFGTCGAGFSGNGTGFGSNAAAGLGGALGSNGTDGANGQDGEPGCDGADGSPSSHTTGFPFWTPGTRGQKGENGEAGNGGGGGGGSGNSGINAGNGGGGGGGGGAGGEGGNGGFSGGASFGVYIVDNGANGHIIDCEIITGSAGTGGTGGIGGVGGFGGGGGARSTANFITSGRGGDGGDGGTGGNGGDGQPGIAQSIYVGGTSLALVAADSTHDFVSEPDIVAENANCANAPVQFSNPALPLGNPGAGVGVTSWTFDLGGTNANPLTGSNNPHTTQYDSVGRYTIRHAGFDYEGFHHIAFDGLFKPTIASSATQIGLDTFQLCVGDFAAFVSDFGGDSIMWDFGGAVANPGNVQNVPGQQFNNPGFYQITLALMTDCCGDSPKDTAYLYVNPLPNPVGSGNISICRQDSGILTVSGLGTQDTVIWSPNTAINIIQQDSVRVYPNTTTTYVATVYKKFSTLGQTITACPTPLIYNVTVEDLPTVTLTTVDVTCNNDGTATATVSGGTGPYEYFWSNGQTTATATASDSITGLAVGNYTVTVRDLGSINACDTVLTALVSPSASVPTIAFSPTNATCNGASDGSATASVINGTAPFDYEWSTGLVENNVATSALSGLAPGFYSVTATDDNGCTDTASVVIGYDGFIVDLNDDTLRMFENSVRQVNAVTTVPSNTNYQWTPNFGLSCTNCLEPTITAIQDTTFYLSATHISGCTFNDTLAVQVFQNDPTDTIEIGLHPDSIFTGCANLPSFFSAAPNVTWTTAGNFAGTFSLPSAGCLTFNPQSNTNNLNTFVLVGCEDGLCDTTVFLITTGSCVWAGDTDRDQIANNNDLLPIGLHHGATGIVRPNASLNWNCQPNQNWGTTVSGLPTVDLKHVDTDGNGIINDDDTLAIIQNWGQFYVKTGQGSFTGAPVFYVDSAIANPGDTLHLPIFLGEVSNLVNDGYGLAFTIEYDNMHIKPNSVSLSYDNSWLGNGSNTIHIQKDFYAQGRIQSAITRIDHTPITGAGQLGTLHLTIEDLVPTNTRIDFRVTNVRLIDTNGLVLPVDPLLTQILVLNPITSLSESVKPNRELQLFPNPASSYVDLLLVEDNIQSIQVSSVNGKVCLSKVINNQQQIRLDLKSLPVGAYIVHVQGQDGRYHKQLIIK